MAFPPTCALPAGVSVSSSAPPPAAPAFARRASTGTRRVLARTRSASDGRSDRQCDSARDAPVGGSAASGLGRIGDGITACSPPAAVQRQRLAEKVVGGHVHRPTVRSRRRSVKGVVCVGEPTAGGRRKGASVCVLERLRRLLVARKQVVRIAGNRLVHPLDSFGRVEPPVAQLDQSLSFRAFRRK